MITQQGNEKLDTCQVARRGFVTIATGAHKYYKLAQNLLHSYRANGKSNLPFAIICDRQCSIAEEFDDVVIIENPYYSFMDKLYLYQYTPYDETIFIDADSLILSDPNILWDDFEQMDDFSCYGRVLPLESRDGWFYYKDMGELQSQIENGISMHGGLYYLRKTQRCQQIFERAMEISKQYDRYVFYYFKEPADEPVLALSMALNKCAPCPKQGRITFFITFEGSIRSNADGNILLKNVVHEPAVLHFGTRNTERFLYRYLLSNVKHKLDGKPGVISKSSRIKLWLSCVPAELKYRVKRAAQKSIHPKVLKFLKKFKHA